MQFEDEDQADCGLVGALHPSQVHGSSQQGSVTAGQRFEKRDNIRKILYHLRHAGYGIDPAPRWQRTRRLGSVSTYIYCHWTQ